MKPPGHAVAVLLLAAGLAGCSAEKPLDPQAEAKRVAFCATVVDVITPGDKTCGPYLDKVRQELERQKSAAAEAEAARPKPADQHGWQGTEYPGVYWRWCDSSQCSTDKVIGDSRYMLAQVWCKTRACGDIYAHINLISDSGVVVGWTNDTAYGGYGQKVQLTFQTFQTEWTKAQLTELNIGG